MIKDYYAYTTPFALFDTEETDDSESRSDKHEGVKIGLHESRKEQSSEYSGSGNLSENYRG